MTIYLQLIKVRWHWDLTDDEGETIAHGSSLDFHEAAECARVAFDAEWKKDELK